MDLDGRGAPLAAAAGAAPDRPDAPLTPAAAALRAAAATLGADAPLLGGTAVVRELRGLPLLPTADGGLRTIQARRDGPLGQPGGGAFESRAVRGSEGGEAGEAARALFVPADEEERALLSALRHRVVAPGLGAPLTARLLALADLGATNVRRVDGAALGALLLPELLPREWRGRRRVGPDEVAAAAATFPGGAAAWEAWLARLWRWLAGRGRGGRLAAAAAGRRGARRRGVPAAGGGVLDPLAAHDFHHTCTTVPL
jgi:hypothetical protein